MWFFGDIHPCLRLTQVPAHARDKYRRSEIGYEILLSGLFLTWECSQQTSKIMSQTFLVRLYPLVIISNNKGMDSTIEAVLGFLNVLHVGILAGN